MYISWGREKGEGVILEAKPTRLQLAFYNLTLRAEPRTLEVEGEEVRGQVRRSRKDTLVYISYSKLNPLPLGGTVEPKGVRLPPGYRVWLTRLPIDTYLTIAFPGGWLYDHVVLTSNKTCIVSRNGRRAYVEEAPSVVSVYFI